MTDVASENEVRRQAESAGQLAPSETAAEPAAEVGAGANAEDPAPEEAVTEEAVTEEAAPEEATTVLDRGRAEVGRVREQITEAVERAGDAVEQAAGASGRVASAMVERLRNDAELAVDRGITRIADEVVEKIAGIAVREVPGVYDIGGDFARILAGLKERVGLGEADEETDRGMRVRLEGHTAQVNITLVIEYGFVVHSVAEKVRTKVISAVENLLGLEVTEVNILVDDVHVPDDVAGHGE